MNILMTKNNNNISSFIQNDCQEFLSILIDKLHEETKIKSNIQCNFKNTIYKYYDNLCKNIEINKDKSLIIQEYNYFLNNKQFCVNYKVVTSYLNHLNKNISLIDAIFGGILMQEIECTVCSAISCNFEHFVSLSLNIDDNNNNNNNIKECYAHFDSKKYGYKIMPYNSKYNLCAANLHYGNIDGGHYTAIVKNLHNEKWYYFDDDKIYVASDNDVADNKNAYVLYYSQN